MQAMQGQLHGYDQAQARYEEPAMSWLAVGHRHTTKGYPRAPGYNATPDIM